MRVINKVGGESVTNPETGETFTAGDDGVFELPHAYGAHLTTKHAAHWATEQAAQGAQQRRANTRLRNPRETANTLSSLLERVSTLESRFAEIEQALNDLNDLLIEPAADETPGDDSEHQPELDAKTPTRSARGRGGKPAAKPSE